MVDRDPFLRVQIEGHPVVGHLVCPVCSSNHAHVVPVDTSGDARRTSGEDRDPLDRADAVADADPRTVVAVRVGSDGDGLDVGIRHDSDRQLTAGQRFNLDGGTPGRRLSTL